MSVRSLFCFVTVVSLAFAGVGARAADPVDLSGKKGVVDPNDLKDPKPAKENVVDPKDLKKDDPPPPSLKPHPPPKP